MPVVKVRVVVTAASEEMRHIGSAQAVSFSQNGDPSGADGVGVPGGEHPRIEQVVGDVGPRVPEPVGCDDQVTDFLEWEELECLVESHGLGFLVGGPTVRPGRPADRGRGGEGQRGVLDPGVALRF